MIDINVGLTANDGTGDLLRNAFIIVNDNFASIDTLLSGTNVLTISQITGLQTALNNIQTQLNYIPALQSDINSINSIIYTINQVLNSQNSSIADLYNEVDNLQTQIYTKIGEAPIDGLNYVRKDGAWSLLELPDFTTPNIDEVLTAGNITVGKTIEFIGASGSSSENYYTILNQTQLVLSQLVTGYQTRIEPGYIVFFSGIGKNITLIGNAFQSINFKPSFTFPTKNSFDTFTLVTSDQLTSYVPYTGATGSVNLGTNNITANSFIGNSLQLNTAAVESNLPGKLYWNDVQGTMNIGLKGGQTIVKSGVDLVVRVVNKVSPNTTLTKAAYQAVKISGAQGQRLAIDLARADNDNNSADTIGLVCETIATNQEGYVMTIGQLEGVNTTGSLQGETWVDGDVLYLSPTTAGRLTKIKPTGTSRHIVVVGYVEYAHSVNGKIYVKIMNGWELDELHNVNIVAATAGQVLRYDGTNWINSNILNTLNGLTASTQSFSIGSTGTDFNITSTGATHTFNLPTASATNRGALSSADWTTFNSKMNSTNPSYNGLLTGVGTSRSGASSDGIVNLTQTWNTTGTPTAFRVNITDTASNVNSLLQDLQVNSSSVFRVTKSGSILSGAITSVSSITSLTGFRLSTLNHSVLGGSTGLIDTTLATFAPTSGTSEFTLARLSTTINQTGGANGITRGLLINPTLTSAADFRAIEVTTGSIVLPYATASSTYAIRTQDYLVNFTSGTFTATLPTAVGCTGKEYRLKNSGTGVITIATTSSQTIDGATTYSLGSQWKYVSVVSTGANWIIMENN